MSDPKSNDTHQQCNDAKASRALSEARNSSLTDDQNIQQDVEYYVPELVEEGSLRMEVENSRDEKPQDIYNLDLPDSVEIYTAAEDELFKAHTSSERDPDKQLAVPIPFDVLGAQCEYNIYTYDEPLSS